MIISVHLVYKSKSIFFCFRNHILLIIVVETKKRIRHHNIIQEDINPYKLVELFFDFIHKLIFSKRFIHHFFLILPSKKTKIDFVLCERRIQKVYY